MSVPTLYDDFRPPTLADEIRSTLGTPGPADSPYSAEVAECYATIAEQLADEPDLDICHDCMNSIALLSELDEEWRTALWVRRLGGVR